MRKLQLLLAFIILLAIGNTANSQVVISQVYGGGGNTGATYKNDFIELFNKGTSPVSLNGWSVQYASATGTSWSKTDLTNVTLAPGQYYLIQEAVGSGGTVNLPTPDATGTIAMSGTAAKVVLVNVNTVITSGTSCPTGPTIVDFVGFGTTANCFEGTGPTPAPSNTNAILRASNGCTDANNNSTDFSVGTPNPRNTASTVNPCGGGPVTNVSVTAGVDAAEPATNGTFLVNLTSPAPAGGVTVTYTLGGTATLNTDYTDALAGSVTIAAGNTSGTITLSPIDDLSFEGTETISITLNTATSPYTISAATASINLQDNDNPTANVVINQVYGGGGNSGATYKNDFIELYNNENFAVSLTGWSVQYASATGTGTWNVTALNGSIPAHGFYLVQEAAGSGGTTNLPAPDATGTISMSGTTAKVILCNTTTAQTGANPAGVNIMDKVGYGSSATGFETAPATGTDNSTSVQRITDGVDNNNNSTDFKVDNPVPRNSAYTTAAPVIVSFTPPNNSVNIPYNIVPAIVFNKPVQKGSGMITFYENGVQATSINVTSPDVVISNNTTVTINTLLVPGKSYYVRIDAGTFKDVYNNSFAGISNNTTWAFTTYNTAIPVTIPVSFDFQDCTGSGLLPNGFTQQSKTGQLVWDCTAFGRNPADSAATAAFPNAVQMNGFAGGTNVPNVDWLISPSLDLTGTTYPLLSFWSRTAFNGLPLQLKVSTNYISGDPSTATWTDINGKFPAQTSNVWSLSQNINLSAFKQPNVHFAFVYTSTDDDGARWTLDDISVVNSLTPPPPSLTVSTNDMQFSYVASGSTTDKTFTFVGNDLTGGVTLTASGAFTLSKDGNNFASSVQYTVEEANNVSETVYVRFAPAQNNQDFTDSVSISTSSLSSTVNLKGTSIDPATTLEVVNWNLEWFGSTTLGPTNDNQQEQNVEKVLKAVAADVYGVVEVVDEARLARVVSNMPGYSYVIGNFGSHVNPPESTGGPLGEAQKLAFIYKTSLLSNISVRPLINKPPSSASYNNWSSGRYPFLMSADVTMNCVTKRINFILIHAKANTSPTATSYARRQAAATELHDTIMNYFAEENVIILGDFNDDLDQSITAGFTTTSYSAFTTDNANFFSPTLALSLAGKKSTVSYNDMIDHVMLSNEMQEYYMNGTASALSDVTSLVTNYGSTTTDHYPVFTRYRFSNKTAPAVTTCTADVNFCSVESNSYTIPSFVATDDCGDVLTYTYSVTGATERNGTGNNASGIFNVGTSTIVWTATDSWGNQATCSTTVIIKPSPSVTIPNAYALPNGTLANTVYIGYLPASSVTLTANASGGTSVYSYIWSNGSSIATTTVSPTTATNYTVTVTDANGCQATANKTIDVIDIRGGKKMDKVNICHKTGVGSNNITISSTDVPDHLAHGDMLGSCTVTTAAAVNARISEPAMGKLSVQVFPNPSPVEFTLLISGLNLTEKINVRILDLQGRIVEQHTNINPTQKLTIGDGFRSGVYFAEITQGAERKIIKLLKL